MGLLSHPVFVLITTTDPKILSTHPSGLESTVEDGHIYSRKLRMEKRVPRKTSEGDSILFKYDVEPRRKE